MKKISEVKNNIKNYAMFKASGNLAILAPVYVLIMYAKGLSFAQIMVVQAVYTFVCTLTDVFSGVLADRIGRKNTLIIGQILIVGSLAVWTISNGFYVTILTKIVYGIGLTFKNGPDISILFETLKKLHKETRFKEVEGKADSIMFALSAIEAVVAGFLFKFNSNLPLALSVVISIINLILIVTFKDPYEHMDIKTSKIHYLKTLKEDTIYLLKNKKMIGLISFSAIYFLFIRLGYIQFTPLLKETTFKLEYIGVAFFLSNMATAYAAKKNVSFSKLFKDNSLNALAMLMMVSLVLLATGNVYLAILGFMIHQSGRGLSTPIIGQYANNILPNDKRAAILSYKSMAMNLTYTVSAVIVSRLDMLSAKQLYIGYALLLAAMLFVHNKTFDEFHEHELEYES